MKNIYFLKLILPISLIIPGFIFSQELPIDYSGVKEAPFNYITSWYTGDSVQMKQALHPKLVKRRVLTTSKVQNTTYDWMINAVKLGFGKIDSNQQVQKDIRILDQTDTIATVKVTSNKFIDYLHIAKLNNQWKVINALWEYKTTPAKGTVQEAEQILHQYIINWKTDDRECLKKILLPEFKGRIALSLTEVDDIDFNWIIDKRNRPNIRAQVKDIKILDICNNMASAKIDYDNFVEYLHLSYIDYQWYIVNSLRNFRLNP